MTYRTACEVLGGKLGELGKVHLRESHGSSIAIPAQFQRFAIPATLLGTLRHFITAEKGRSSEG